MNGKHGTLWAVFLQVCFTICLTTPAMAEDAEWGQELDVSEFRDQLRVFEAPEGHVLVFVPFGDSDWIFWGKPNDVLYQQVTPVSHFAGTESFDYSLRDRRLNAHSYKLSMRDGTYFATCGQRRADLRLLDVEEGLKKLEGARFLEPRWGRTAHYLARDDFGVYYFVDKVRTRKGETASAESYRVHIGWKGEMLQTPLRLVAQDSVGDVFGMINGDRRLVINHGVGKYLEGDEMRELHKLDIRYDSPLMYLEGGVYAGLPHGTLCDLYFEER